MAEKLITLSVQVYRKVITIYHSFIESNIVSFEAMFYKCINSMKVLWFNIFTNKILSKPNIVWQ